MKKIGIDPALRANGLAVAVLDSETGKCYSFRFRKYNDFYKWTLNLPVKIVGAKCAPVDCSGKIQVCIENSALDNVTFRGQSTRRNKYAAISRDAGKNMAVSALIIDAMEALNPEKLKEIAPSKKTPISERVIIAALNAKGYQLYKDASFVNEDEWWAIRFALYL